MPAPQIIYQVQAPKSNDTTNGLLIIIICILCPCLPLLVIGFAAASAAAIAALVLMALPWIFLTAAAGTFLGFLVVKDKNKKQALCFISCLFVVCFFCSIPVWVHERSIDQGQQHQR